MDMSPGSSFNPDDKIKLVIFTDFLYLLLNQRSDAVMAF